jgi:kynureninase
MQFQDQLKQFQDQCPGKDAFSLEFAQKMDEKDELKEFRSEFLFPKTPNNKPPVYLCGNSLGLQPKNTRVEVLTYLDKWADEAVEGHFTGEEFLCRKFFC